MDTKSWEAVREIFDAALELPSKEREEYVRHASDGNAAVFAEVAALLQAEEGAGDFLETPIVMESAVLPEAVEPPLRKGDLLCRRFRIVRLLGEGGMGHVFEAWDEELGRSVALKAIRPEIASHPESLKRFRREVSLALKITHPNVCRTFDIERDARVLDAAQGASTEVLFLTMEYLEGETLATRLARTGALPLNDALLIATQLADALICAHEAGILHRDIKPSNIMLVDPAISSGSGSGNGSATSGSTLRAVITDFGLARQEALFQTSDLTTVSRTGIPIGTFAYMAPEQLEGAETSPATDIYALGLVLFEMATGQRAFPSSNPLGSVKERLTGRPPSPKALVPNLPEPWCRAIEGCLRVHAEERFQSTQEVATVLHGGRVMLPRATSSYGRSRTPVRPQRWMGVLPDWSTRRLLVGASLIFLLAVSLLLGGLRLYQSKAEAKVTPGALVYLTQVKNQTGEKAFDNLTELMQAGLTQSAQFNLLDQARIGDTLQHMTKAPDTVIDEPIAREIAMRTGAARVVFATVSGTNGNYSLAVDIQQPDNSPGRYREDWKKTFKWQLSSSTRSADQIPQELLSAVRNSSDWIRKEVGESQNDIVRMDASPEDVTTGSWEALAEYTNAQQLQAHQQTEDAVEHLKQAVKIDPSFALAWGQLGDLQYDLDRYNDGNASYERALQTGAEKRLTRRERDRILGAFAFDTEDYQTAAEAYRDYALVYKNDYLGFFGQGRPLLLTGRYEEAKAVLEKALESDKTRRSPALQLASLYMMLNDLDKASEYADAQESLGRKGDAGKFHGQIAFLALQFQKSEDYFKEMQSSSDPFAMTMSLSLLARLSAERGQYDHALQWLDKGIELDRSHGDHAEQSNKLLDRAYLRSRMSDYKAALEDIHQAVLMDPSAIRIETASSILGEAIPKAPEPISRAMRSELTELATHFHVDELSVISKITNFRVQGEILLANHQWHKAIDCMRKADALDIPIGPREYLGRALQIAAVHELDPIAASKFREQAIEAYGKVALTPGFVWSVARQYPPGFLADQLIAYLNVDKLNQHAASMTPVLFRLKALRPEFAGSQGKLVAFGRGSM